MLKLTARNGDDGWQVMAAFPGLRHRLRAYPASMHTIMLLPQGADDAGKVCDPWARKAFDGARANQSRSYY